MPELTWKTIARPTAFHAAMGLDRGLAPCIAGVEETIGPTVERIRNLLALHNVDQQGFWNHLIALSASNDSMSAIITNVARKMLGPTATDSRIAIDLVQLLAAVIEGTSAATATLGDLRTRMEPLQLQWQTYGAGLLRQIGRLTDEQAIVARADVILVQPVFGGAGVPNLDYNCVCIEAMLVNPHDDLPEVLRLAWLLSQLQNDLPIFSETISRRRLATTSGLAMLPAALQSAQELSLAAYDRSMLERSMSAWHLANGDVAETSEIVASWWATVQTGGFGWATALQSLDRMLTA